MQEYFALINIFNIVSKFFLVTANIKKRKVFRCLMYRDAFILRLN